MLADFLGKPRILEAFRLVNGAPGIAEAIIRWYGPIRANQDGFTKDRGYKGPTPAEIVKPLRAVTPAEQQMALRYLASIECSSSSDETQSSTAELSSERRDR